MGIANHIGDVLTYQVLTDDTQQVIYGSLVRPLDIANPNIRVLHPLSDREELEEPAVPIVKTLTETIDPEYDPKKTKLPKFSPEELLGPPSYTTLQMDSTCVLKSSKESTI